MSIPASSSCASQWRRRRLGLTSPTTAVAPTRRNSTTPSRREARPCRPLPQQSLENAILAHLSPARWKNFTLSPTSVTATDYGLKVPKWTPLSYRDVLYLISSNVHFVSTLTD